MISLTDAINHLLFHYAYKYRKDNNNGRAHIQILIHWGRVKHLYVGKLIIIVSDNGMAPERRQAIIWTNDGIWFIGSLGTNVGEMLLGIHTFSFNKLHLKISSAKWRPLCLSLNVLNAYIPYMADHDLSIDVI